VEIPRAWPVADPADSGRYTCAQLFAEEMTDIAGTDRLVHTGLACLRLGDRVDSLVTDGHHGRRALDLLDQGNFPQWPGPVLETKSDRIHFLVQTAPPPRAPSPQALLRHLGPGAWLWCPDSGDDNRTWWLRAPQPDDTGRARLGAAGPVLQALADSGRPMGFGQRLLSTS
jgi:hypothetical protein